MEYRLLLLLFYAVSVNCECGDLKNELTEVKEKIDKLEDLLYKVLMATESHLGGSDTDVGVCLSLDHLMKTEDCINKDDIKCTSIDFVNKRAACFKCVMDTSHLGKPCKHYIPINTPLDIHNKTVGNITIEIDDSGTLSLNPDNIIINKFKFPEIDCYCTWSQYLYTNINKNEHLQVNQDHGVLFCDDTCSQQHCVLENTTAICYEREINCAYVQKNGSLSCIIDKYVHEENASSHHPITINLNEKKCQNILELSDCNFTFIFSNKSMETIIDTIMKNDKLEYSDDLIEYSNISCYETCFFSFHDICINHYDTSCKLITTEPTVVTTATTPRNITSNSSGGGFGSTAILVVIIVILLLLLIMYFGYQNQWHHKIISYVNGTADQTRPVPSNRRGRMKGKYAPLPRTVEETVPRHDD